MSRPRLNRTCYCAIAIIILFVTASCSVDPSAPVFEKAEGSLAAGRHEEAIVQYSYVVNKHPGSAYAPQSQYKIAYIYNRYLNDKKSALLAYQTLYYMYPGSKETNVAHEDLAIIYSKEGDHRKAIENYQKILGTRVPDENNRIHYMIAVEYFNMNDLQQSRVEFHELLKTAKKPELVSNIFFQLGSIDYIEGRHKEAIEWFDRLVEKFPDKVFTNEARFAKARVLRDTGKYAEAVAMLRAIEKEYPDKQAVKSLKDWIENRLAEGPEPRNIPDGIKKPE